MVSGLVGRLMYFLDRVGNYFRRARLLQQMDCGRDVSIGSGSVFTPATVKIGDDVSIGRNCCFQSAHGEIVIGNHVLFGPGVHIHGGNHVTNQLGDYMKHVSTKRAGDDGRVVVEDDCWIGARAIILRGVTVGRGSVIGAGSVVTGDIPRYSIYTGAPAQRLRPRFTPEQILEHETLLRETYPSDG